LFEAYCIDCQRKLRTFADRQDAEQHAQRHADKKQHRCAVLRYLSPFHFDMQALRDMKACPKSLFER